MKYEVDRPVFRPLGFHDGLNVKQVAFVISHLRKNNMGQD
jgi:hypothetical protein